MNTLYIFSFFYDIPHPGAYIGRYRENPVTPVTKPSVSAVSPFHKGNIAPDPASGELVAAALDRWIPGLYLLVEVGLGHRLEARVEAILFVTGEKLIPDDECARRQFTILLHEG